jgi:hypothetical protein
MAGGNEVGSGGDPCATVQDRLHVVRSCTGTCTVRAARFGRAPFTVHHIVTKNIWFIFVLPECGIRQG